MKTNGEAEPRLELAASRGEAGTTGQLRDFLRLFSAPRIASRVSAVRSVRPFPLDWSGFEIQEDTVLADSTPF